MSAFAIAALLKQSLFLDYEHWVLLLMATFNLFGCAIPRFTQDIYLLRH